MTYRFLYDERLGIRLPQLDDKWEKYSRETKEDILLEWEKIRGMIPDRIRAIEKQIERKQQLLGQEENFERSCEINHDISELASVINDLWLWFRTRQHIGETR